MATTDLRLFGPAGLTLGVDAWAPDGVRGADKVAQRLIYALMTPQGSVPGRPDDGSPFLRAAANFTSEFDLFAAFAAAEPAAARTVRGYELDTDPDSDRYGASRLAKASVSGAGVVLTFEVVAKDRSKPSVAIDVTLTG